MITKWLNEEWLGKKSFRPTGGKYLVPKEKLSFKNHNVKPSSCRLVCASMTRGMKALISLPNTYTDTQTHECRWPHWQVTSCLGIQSSLQQRQGCRGPFGFVWSATSRLCPHTCRRWDILERSVTGNRKVYKNLDIQKRKVYGTHRKPCSDLPSGEEGLTDNQNPFVPQCHFLWFPPV